MMGENLVQQGIAALKEGRKTEARSLLAQAVKQEPTNEMAWMWLGGVVETDKERRFCLERVLAINPQNDTARRALQRLLAGAGQPPPAREPVVREPVEQAALDKPIEQAGPAEGDELEDSQLAAESVEGEDEGWSDAGPDESVESDRSAERDELAAPADTPPGRPSTLVIVGGGLLAVAFIVLAALFWALGTGALSWGKATSTPAPTVQALPTFTVALTPSPSLTLPPTWTPRDTYTPQPTWTFLPSRTPRPTYTPFPSWTPTLTGSPTIALPPTITPTLTVTPTLLVTPTSTRASSWVPTPRITVPPTWTPLPTSTPAPGMTLPPTWTPLPTWTPRPGETATPENE